MAYTDEELMLLEQLTYLNDDVYKAAGLNDFLKVTDIKAANDIEALLEAFNSTAIQELKEKGSQQILNDNNKKTHISGAEWAQIIESIQKNDKLKNLELSHITTVDSSDGDGYNIDTMCFNEPGNKDDAIVCFRGTLNGKEWNDNGEYICAARTDCNQAALVYINGLPYSNITVVGHSKGANKAAYVYFESDKVNYCVSMDMPGFPTEYFHEMASVIAAKKDGFHPYALESDYVNILVLPVPDVETIYLKGYGVDGFAENHCPNCFFYYDEADSPHTTISKIGQNNAMKALHNFTAFVALEMPYAQRIEVGNYLGDVLEMLLGGGEYSFKDKVDILLSDVDSLATIAAYFKKYCAIYDKDEIGLLKTFFGDSIVSDCLKLEKFNLPLISKLGILKTDFIFLFLLVYGVDGKISNDKKLKEKIERLVSMLISNNLSDKIKEKYTALDTLQKPLSLDYKSYGGKKYDYTQETYSSIKSNIRSFNDIEYSRPSSVWNDYADFEWYESICADSIKEALTSFIDKVPVLNENCGLEFDNTFHNEWDVDEQYMNIYSSQMRKLDSCIQKFVVLKERMEFNTGLSF